jgi:hypothetical protein
MLYNLSQFDKFALLVGYSAILCAAVAGVHGGLRLLGRLRRTIQIRRRTRIPAPWRYCWLESGYVLL